MTASVEPCLRWFGLLVQDLGVQLPGLQEERGRLDDSNMSAQMIVKPTLSHV